MAVASPAQAAPIGNAGSQTASNIQSAQEYWTPERMKSAIPADLPQAAARPQAVPRQGPSGTHDGVAPKNLQAQADVNTMSGRVFFVNDLGQNRSCSGSTVNSAGKRLVFTAGHCVHGGGSGRGWFDVNRWVFVPGYNNGNRPYGTWSAYQQWTKTAWINNANRAFDVAAVVMQLLNGTRIVDAVGGQGIKWGAGYGLRIYMFGYPADPPFNGSQLYFCWGNTRNEGGFPTLDCNMTGGASGGPWLENYGATFWAYVNGVNSWMFWRNNDPAQVYKWQSPYFSYDTAGSLYDTVKNM
ncbi:peptidase [Lentzea sp. NBRC 105346]|uniref:trypsin-like serine peptidase n=1 Tax=Lentzea sp. NBRC 105346 TaxID=3032205 RepID=UPI0025544292|nr:peptidase [Lentzea sp. NBRC 105346]